MRALLRGCSTGGEVSTSLLRQNQAVRNGGQSFQTKCMRLRYPSHHRRPFDGLRCERLLLCQGEQGVLRQCSHEPNKDAGEKQCEPTPHTLASENPPAKLVQSNWKFLLHGALSMLRKPGCTWCCRCLLHLASHAQLKNVLHRIAA